MHAPQKEYVRITGLVALLATIACSQGMLAQKPMEVAEKKVEEMPVTQPEPPKKEIQSVEMKKSSDLFIASEHLQPVYFDVSRSTLDEQSMETIKTNAAWL